MLDVYNYFSSMHIKNSLHSHLHEFYQKWEMKFDSFLVQTVEFLDYFWVLDCQIDYMEMQES